MRTTVMGMVLAATLLAGCTPNAFSDRPATLSHVEPASDGSGVMTAAETERQALRNYHALDAGARDGMDRRTYRDAVVWRQVAADEDGFNRFVRAIRADRSLMSLSTDEAVIFLNGLATVTGTAGEKAALAAISGGLLSTKGAFDKELFNLETMAALIARMKAARRAAMVPIEAGLAEDIQSYPLERALRDLRVYADAGSLSSTIDAIADDAGRVTQAAAVATGEITRGAVYRDSLDRRDAIGARIGALPATQALAMVVAMERARGARTAELRADLKAFDPADARFKNGDNARRFLLYWLRQESGAPDQLDEWDAALAIAQKG